MAVVLASLLFIAALGWLSALLQNLDHARRRGPAFVMGDRSQPLDLTGLGGRMARALANLGEASLMYAPAALVAVTLHLGSAPVRLAAAGFMAARAGYAASYWLGASRARSALWTLGMACTAVMVFEGAAALLRGGRA